VATVTDRFAYNVKMILYHRMILFQDY
jgi:hypothetical protein